MKLIRQFLLWIKKWFWDKPVSKPEPPKATEAVHLYVVVDYKGQKINLKKSQLNMWNSMSRHDKRGMAQKFANMEKKGMIRFETINGRLTCIKNKDYENHVRQQGDGEAGSRK